MVDFAAKGQESLGGWLVTIFLDLVLGAIALVAGIATGDVLTAGVGAVGVAVGAGYVLFLLISVPYVLFQVLKLVGKLLTLPFRLFRRKTSESGTKIEKAKTEKPARSSGWVSSSSGRRRSWWRWRRLPSC